MGDPGAVRIDKLKIGMLTDDGVFPASAAIQRAVREAGAALRERGAEVVELEAAQFAAPKSLDELFDLYCRLISADGAADWRRYTRGSTVDWRVWRMTTLAGSGR
jgi:Asp-tRNA(Asn)/Glu-tRNA(Gln) amidotransferase A subunit family amidase